MPQYISGMQQYDVFFHIWKKVEITTHHKPGKGTSFPENPIHSGFDKHSSSFQNY
jgi:hypothetical protein